MGHHGVMAGQPTDNRVTTELSRADAADRAAKARRLRVAGATWEVIAMELGYGNKSNVCRAVKSFEADGSHMRRPKTSTGTTSWVLTALREAGLERLTPHDLRQTAASLAISAGAHVKAVQRMLEHKFRGDDSRHLRRPVRRRSGRRC